MEFRHGTNPRVSPLGEATAAGETDPMSIGRDIGKSADSDPFGLREGEVAAPLPEHFDASLYFIGRIRTPWTRREDCPKNARESEAICTCLTSGNMSG